jgi:NAD(P)-dependent dehydrogenase (short-subunit alcohol dehydrogenase family)
MKSRLFYRWLVFLAYLVTPWSAASGAAVMSGDTSTASLTSPPWALITGSDRGIGFALVQELETRGWRVVATCRDPAHADALRTFAAAHPLVTIEPLDVTDNVAIEALSARYRGQPIDVLVNNAGIAPNLGSQGIGSLGPEDFAQVMRVNTYAPLKMSVAFLDQVAASRQKKIVSISSGMGSLLQAPQYRGTTYYSISKAGLNMAMRLLEAEVRGRGVLVGLVVPGPVDTDMSRAYRATAAQSGRPVTTPVLSPAESARTLADFIAALGPERSGRFYSYNGQEVPW